MRLVTALLCAIAAAAIFSTQNLPAQSQQPQQDQSGVPTFRVTSTLVFLDVTVLDKKGHTVVTGLTKDDFRITEDKKPQRIFSFEAPEAHIMGANAGDDNPDGKAPVTILVLDLLDSRFEDFAYIRYEARKFLMAQPDQLASPAELMVVGNDALEMLQGFTRNREDLVYALDHLPAALPYKDMNGFFAWERFGQSVDALQQIAMQNNGVPGRKNVIWVGHGGPGIFLDPAQLTEPLVEQLKEYAHETTNMLVDARVCLFVIYPGLHVNRGGISLSGEDSEIDLNEDDPFSGNIDFGLFANATGGKLYFNRNDVDRLIGRSEQLGSNYYTLTYQPSDAATDGKFRRIRVTLKDRNLRVVTKAGYFAPDPNAPVDPRQQAIPNLPEAAISTVPFTALHVSLLSIVRHPDTRTLSMIIQLQDKNLPWLASGGGKSKATLLLGAVSRNNNGDVLASRMEGFNVVSPLQDPTARAALATPLSITLRFPRKATNVRVVVESEVGGRMGAVDLTRQVIDAAPAEPTPSPHLTPHRPEYVPQAAKAPAS